MTKYLALCLLLFSLGMQAQENTNPDGPLPAAALQVKPEYPGGMKAFYAFVGNSFQVPDVEFEKDTTLKVFLTFVIEKDGSLTDIRVVRDPGYGIGKEAIRIMSLSEKWTPGVQNGTVVRTSFTIPIAVNIEGTGPVKKKE